MSDMRRMMMMFTRPVEASIPMPTILPAVDTILPTQAITISISGEATSAEYSFDNQTWITYSGTFTLSGATTVYARATDGNGNYSNVASRAYTIFPYDAQVEYLQSSGTQYIDTGIYGENDVSYELKAICTSDGKNYWIGAWADSYASLAFCCGKDNGVNRFFAAYNSGGTTTLSQSYFTTDNVVTITQANGVFTINGDEVRTITSQASFSTSPYSLYLFAQNRKGTLQATSCKICYCKIYKNNTLVRDFIPVRVEQVGYLYDKVSKTLFGNNGTGSFTYGNDVTT